MNKQIKYIQKSYPNAKDIVICELFNPNKGWNKSLQNSISQATINHLQEIGVTHVNIKLVDEFGQIRYPDYSIKELI